MLDNFPRGTICIEELEIGMSRHIVKEVTDRDIELFAEVSTDRNPVHLDDDFAKDTIFQGRIAHGDAQCWADLGGDWRTTARAWHHLYGPATDLLGPLCAPATSCAPR